MLHRLNNCPEVVDLPESYHKETVFLIITFCVPRSCCPVLVVPFLLSSVLVVTKDLNPIYSYKHQLHTYNLAILQSDDMLVGRAAEGEGDIALALNVRTIDDDIDVGHDILQP